MNDGWDIDAIRDTCYSADVADTFDSLGKLDYELNNCVRGTYTRAKTYKELGEYIVSLGENLTNIGNDIINHEEDLDDTVSDK